MTENANVNAAEALAQPRGGYDGDASRAQRAQIYATLAVADELRALRLALCGEGGESVLSNIDATIALKGGVW